MGEEESGRKTCIVEAHFSVQRPTLVGTFPYLLHGISPAHSRCGKLSRPAVIASIAGSEKKISVSR